MSKSDYLRPTKSILLEYERSLRKVARHVADLTKVFGSEDSSQLVDALNRYADALTPWATIVARKMLETADRQNIRAWKQFSRDIYEVLKDDEDVGVAEELLQAQVELITSLPTGAAERVMHVAHEGVINGWRATDTIREIMKTGQVTLSRAKLIARTETSRAASALTEVRARKAGSPGYVWRSHKDARTRESHRKMNGVFVDWNQPPTLDGMTGHAGCLPNCRCFAMPVFEGS